MKPFDIEKAKAGAKVITRCEHPVRILCFDLEGRQPIGAAREREDFDGVVSEVLHAFGSDGRYYTGTTHDEDSSLDLFMAPEKRYVAVWLTDKGIPAVHPLTFVSEEQARAALYPLSGYQIVEFDV